MTFLALMATASVGYFVVVGANHAIAERKLEKSVIEIQQDIADGNYDSTRIKTNSLRMDDGWSTELERRWDQERGDFCNS